MKTIVKDIKDRTRGLGSSDIGSLFGMNKRCSLPKLWLEKTGRLFDQQESEPIEWGQAFEQPVAKRFAEKTGRRIQRFNRTAVHPKYGFLLANPDRFQFDPARGSRRARKGVLEIKCTIFANLRQWSTSGVPANFYLQIQHQMSCTGCEWGSFAVFFGGNKLVEFDVERDEKIIALIIERARAFWDLVQKDTPPPITLDMEWNKHLAQYFPTPVKGEERRLETPAAIGRARRYLHLKAQIEKREAEMEEHEVFFKSAIENAELLLVPGIARFTWSGFERKHVDLDKLRSEHPAIAEALTTKIPQRRFTCKALTDVIEEGDEPEDEPMPIVGARRVELE